MANFVNGGNQTQEFTLMDEHINTKDNMQTGTKTHRLKDEDEEVGSESARPSNIEQLLK